jgi:hypothetical protein
VKETPLIALGCVLLASLLGAAGQFLFKLAANRGGSAALGFLATPWAFVGLTCYVAVMLLFSLAFRSGGTVTVLYPLYASTLFGLRSWPGPCTASPFVLFTWQAWSCSSPG